jgi:ATP-binding cassette subfamily B multidrug efflux pump
MHNFRYLLPYMLRYWATLVLGLCFIVAANLVALVPPYFIQLVINGLQHQMTYDQLLRLGAAIIGVGVGAGVLQFLSRFVVNSVSRYAEYDVRSDLFNHFQRLDLAFFQNAKLGDLVARATNDLSAVRMMLGPGITNLTNAVVAVVATVVAMLVIDPRLTLYSMLVMPLITVLFIGMRRGIERRFRSVQDQFGEVSALAQEDFSGIRVVKAYVQEEQELAAFNKTNQKYADVSVAFARLDALLWPSMYGISGFAVAVLLWVGGRDVIQGTLQLGQLVQFNAYLVALSWPMIALGWTFNLFQQGSASMTRVREVMETKPAMADSPATRVGFMPTVGAVEFRHVSLAYGDREMLHDVSFAIPPGGILAIVGPTGAGKSSIVNLIPRVVDATSGQVLVDGVDVREIPLDALRHAIGYVPQETFLFSMSLRDNIGFGVQQLSDDELAHALDIAQLAGDVAGFPQGADTILGERGVTLSGGQKQRAGIARAIARNPLILILDDAFSSVDTNTEAEILTRLRQVMRGRTSIVIAHRISTVKDADEILVLDRGRIIEHGTHASLLALGGLYADIYRRQLLSDELDDANGQDAHQTSPSDDNGPSAQHPTQE